MHDRRRMKDTPYREEQETPEDTRAPRSDPEEPMQHAPDSDIGEAVEGKRGDATSTWHPPTDPVVEVDPRGNAKVLGGFAADSMDAPVEGSMTRGQGDEAIADAVRRELREDAATTDLDVRVEVEDGIVRITGRVSELQDAENAEAVAARLPEVREVIDDIEVPGLDRRSR
jgi:hypothetical protein